MHDNPILPILPPKDDILAYAVGPVTAAQLAAWRMHHLKQSTFEAILAHYNTILQLGRPQTVDQFITDCLIIGAHEKIQSARRNNTSNP